MISHFILPDLKSFHHTDPASKWWLEGWSQIIQGRSAIYVRREPMYQPQALRSCLKPNQTINPSCSVLPVQTGWGSPKFQEVMAFPITFYLRTNWRCQPLNLGPSACRAHSLPLSTPSAQNWGKRKVSSIQTFDWRCLLTLELKEEFTG